MPLACEDGEQVEAHKVILAGQVLFNKLSNSHHHINNIFININTNSTNIFPIRFLRCWNRKSSKMFVCLIVWAGAKQSRSPGAEQTTQVRVYQLPVGVDGLASLA